MICAAAKTSCCSILAMVIAGCNSGREASFRPESSQAPALVRATDDNFQITVLERDRPVFVEFWSARCVPCLEMRSTVKELLSEFGHEVIFAELNVDANPDTAKMFGVTSLPFCMVFRRGEVAQQLEGSRPRAEIADTLRDMLRD